MTPSNQHSDEAIAAYPMPEVYSPTMAGWYGVMDKRTAFDSGRESKQHTNREILSAMMGDAGISSVMADQLADEILAAPSLSLVAVRDELFELIADRIGEHSKSWNAEIADSGEYETYTGKVRVESMAEWIMQGVVASGIVKLSSEVEAAALEAAATGLVKAHKPGQMWRSTAYRWLLARAARVRSGKGEA